MEFLVRFITWCGINMWIYLRIYFRSEMPNGKKRKKYERFCSFLVSSSIVPPLPRLMSQWIPVLTPWLKLLLNFFLPFFCTFLRLLCCKQRRAELNLCVVVNICTKCIFFNMLSKTDLLFFSIFRQNASQHWSKKKNKVAI